MLSLEKQNALREQYRQQQTGWRPATEVYADLVRRSLTPTARVLDLGCGRGGLVEQLDHPIAQVVGVDPDWLSLAEHRLSLPRVVAFSDDLPFAEGSFDLIFASWLLEHLANPGRTFQAISHCLRPKGLFLFLTPNGRHPLSLLNRAFGRLGAWQGQLVERVYGRASADTFPTYYRANSPTQLRQIGTQCGLTLRECHTIPDPTYLAFNSAMFRFMGWLEPRLPADRRLHIVGVYEKLG